MKIILLICLTLVAHIAHGSSQAYRNNLNSCTASKEAINDYEPKIFNPSNNLLRNPGALPVICGQRLVLRGKLVDSKCVPISDAKVYLWQVGCDGKYPYEPLRTIAKRGHHINTSSGSTFLGNGVATTDNNGEFQFITIYPAKSEHGKHVINLRAEHREVGEIQVQLSPSNDEVYDFTIVMKDQNLYRRY